MSSSKDGRNQSVNAAALEAAVIRDAIPAVAHPALISRVFSAPDPTALLNAPEIVVPPQPHEAFGSTAPPFQVCGAVAK